MIEYTGPPLETQGWDRCADLVATEEQRRDQQVVAAWCRRLDTEPTEAEERSRTEQLAREYVAASEPQ